MTINFSPSSIDRLLLATECDSFFEFDRATIIDANFKSLVRAQLVWSKASRRRADLSRQHAEAGPGTCNYGARYLLAYKSQKNASMIDGRVGTRKRPRAKHATRDNTRGGPSRHWTVPPISGSCHTGHFVFGCDSIFLYPPNERRCQLQRSGPSRTGPAEGKPKASRKHEDPQR